MSNEESERVRPTSPELGTEREDALAVVAQIIEGSNMTPKAAASFGIYASLPATRRTLAELREACAAAWGRAPDMKTLKGWSAAFGWERLLVRFEASLIQLRAQRLELARRQHVQQALGQARELRDAAAAQALRMIASFNEPLGDPASWPSNPRTKQPMPPKRSLAGLQAVGFLWKAALDGERLILSLPTSVTDSKLAADVHQETTVTLSLEEWRTRTKREREAAEAEQAAQVAAAGGGDRRRPALPAPGQRHPRTLANGQPLSSLREDLARDLPDDWFDEQDEDAGQVVDADPDPANPLDDAQALEAEDDPDEMHADSDPGDWDQALDGYP